MDRKYVDYYKVIFKNLGRESQERMCIEEMSELTKELCKRSRYAGTDKENEVCDNIIEELADVLNCVEQLVYIYGEDKVEEVRKAKFKRFFDKYKFD
ncbi:MAG: hypothetical protein E7345_00820 [Clostridiales bacterium]|nr:hypothetical protein [Clostridiales bacterium]